MTPETPAPTTSSLPDRRDRDILVFLGLFNIYFSMFFFRSPSLLVKLLPVAEYLWLAALLFGLRRRPWLRRLVWPTVALFLGPVWWALANGWLSGGE